jgi:hypothetical protein
LRAACSAGHIAVATWLVDRFALTVADAQSTDSYALRVACSNNHPGIVEFLAAPWPVGIGATLTEGLARWRFQEAARDGRHEMMQVLSDHAGINNAGLAAHAAPQQ